MKKLLCAVLLASTMPVLAADVGVSIEVGEPNFYGRIDIGNVSRPVLIYEEPIIVRQTTVVRSPVYLRVPPGHAKNWSKHCARYDACGRPAYFVQDDWYNNSYAPQVKAKKKNKDKGSGKSKGKGHDKDH